MKILILGGSRFIGAWLTRRLLDAGHTVTLFNRGASEPPFSLDGADRIIGDIDEIDQRADALAALQPDVVVHMLIVDAQRAWDLIRLFAPTDARVLFISSADVYRAYDYVLRRDTGAPIPVPFDEDAPLRRRLYPYRPALPDEDHLPEDADGWRRMRRRDGYDKIPAEWMFRAAFGARGTILRLPAVYGPGDFQHRIYSIVKRVDDRRPFLLMDDQMAGWRWTRGYVADMAEAIALAVEKPAAGGRTYNVASHEILNNRDWTQAVVNRMGWSGELALRAAAQLPSAMRHEEDFDHDVVLDTRRIREELGYQEVASLEDGLDATIEWERANPPQRWADPFDYDLEDAVYRGELPKEE